jgi:hypothetical protein
MAAGVIDCTGVEQLAAETGVWMERQGCGQHGVAAVDCFEWVL